MSAEVMSATGPASLNTLSSRAAAAEALLGLVSHAPAAAEPAPSDHQTSPNPSPLPAPPPTPPPMQAPAAAMAQQIYAQQHFAPPPRPPTINQWYEAHRPQGVPWQMTPHQRVDAPPWQMTTHQQLGAPQGLLSDHGTLLSSLAPQQTRAPSAAAPQQHPWSSLVNPRGVDILARGPAKAIGKDLNPAALVAKSQGRRRGRGAAGSKYSWVTLQPPPDKALGDANSPDEPLTPGQKPNKKLRGHAGYSWKPLN